MAEPDFSIIICSYNRSHNLPECLAHVARQEQVADLAWEVVIVDNNSSDDTRQVVEALTEEYPDLNIRYLFEPEQGLSAARNCGIRNTHGSWYLFIDDDIRPSPGWLRGMATTLRDNDADAVGGRIHIEQRFTLPNWIRPDMYGFLGQQDFGDSPKQLDGVREFPFGGNMGFQRRVFASVGPFDNSYGRKGEGKKREELLKGEETDYFHRLAKVGGRIFYSPEGLVYHRIEAFQLKQRYFRTIHFNQGLLTAVNDPAEHPRRLFGVPRFVFGQTLRSAWTYLREVLSKGPNHAFRQQMNVAHRLGLISGYRRARARHGELKSHRDAPTG